MANYQADDHLLSVKNNQVIFEHYRKPIASNLMIMQRSAMPDRVKRAAITQIAIKILEKTSQDVPWTRKHSYCPISVSE